MLFEHINFKIYCCFLVGTPGAKGLLGNTKKKIKELWIFGISINKRLIMLDLFFVASLPASRVEGQDFFS